LRWRGCSLASYAPLTEPEPVVVAELDPATHPFAKKMDARVEPAHDEVEATS
jgi:hypothetical protein